MGEGSSPDLGQIVGQGLTQAGLGGLSGFLTYGLQKKLQQRQFDFSHQEAELSRGWQERMSNTAYQRQVEDMRSAGINPMVAAQKGGGAATPSGATATGAGASAPSIDLGSVSSAVQAGFEKARLMNEKALLDKTLEVKNQDINTSAAQESLHREQASKTREEAITEQSRRENLNTQSWATRLRLDELLPYEKYELWKRAGQLGASAKSLELGFPEKEMWNRAYNFIGAMGDALVGALGASDPKEAATKLLRLLGVKDINPEGKGGFTLEYPKSLLPYKGEPGPESGWPHRAPESRAYETGGGNTTPGGSSAADVQRSQQGRRGVPGAFGKANP